MVGRCTGTTWIGVVEKMIYEHDDAKKLSIELGISETDKAYDNIFNRLNNWRNKSGNVEEDLFEALEKAGLQYICYKLKSENTSKVCKCRFCNVEREPNSMSIRDYYKQLSYSPPSL